MASPQTSAESNFVDVNGQRLHYKKWSDNGPPLIFLHGVTSSSAGWDLIAPRFASDYSVLAFDFRGHGLSSKPDQGYHWADGYAADIVAFLQGHVNEPAVLIGHSLGAMVTVPVAVQVPDKVRAIIMEDPPAFGPTESQEQTRERFRPILALKQLPFEIRVERFMEGSSLNRSAAVRRAEELGAMHEQVLVELMAGNTAFKPADWFPRVTCPSLVILGSPHRGGVVMYEDRPRMQRMLPGARLVEWDDVGHLIHFQKIEQFEAEIRTFLRELP